MLGSLQNRYALAVSALVPPKNFTPMSPLLGETPRTPMEFPLATESPAQAVPCRAGVLSAVVYSNGDVSVCELHEPLGNLRQQGFWEIWNGERAKARRRAIACKECWCTTEVFLWPSLTYQPQYLAKAMLGGRVWQKAGELAPGEKPTVRLEDAYGPATAASEDRAKLDLLQAPKD